jgi:hypothetical protein
VREQDAEAVDHRTLAMQKTTAEICFSMHLAVARDAYRVLKASPSDSSVTITRTNLLSTKKETVPKNAQQ